MHTSHVTIVGELVFFHIKKELREKIIRKKVFLHLLKTYSVCLDTLSSAKNTLHTWTRFCVYYFKSFNHSN